MFGSIGRGYLIAILLGETGPIRIVFAIRDGPFVYLIRAGRAHDEEEGVDGASFEGLAVEAERVGGVLEEEGWGALGFGDVRL
jgi:hypothetical protein